MPRKRIDWTTFEQAELYAATMDLIKMRKLPTPVPPGKMGSQFIKLLQEAQIKLPENRRRPLANVDALGRGELAKRFVDNGIIPPNYLEVYRKGAKNKHIEPAEAPPPDPRDLKINELGEEIEHWKLRAQNAEATVRTWEALPKPPTEAQVIKGFISDILAEAARKGAQGVTGPLTEFKPPPKLEIPQKEALPAFEKERRARGSEPVQEGRSWIPKIALIGGDEAHNLIDEAVKGMADMRFFGTRGAGGDDHLGERLKAFKDPQYGKVVLWTKYTSHQATKSLQYQNIPFIAYHGERGGLIEKIKEIAKGLQSPPKT